MWNSSRKAPSLLIAVMAIGAILVGTNAKATIQSDVTIDGRHYTPHAAFFVTVMYGAKLEMCYGAIIGRRHIITSGDCGVRDTIIGIVFGKSDDNDESKNGFEVERVFRHPNYTDGSLEYNLTIIELPKNESLTQYFSAIPLPTSTPNINSEGIMFTTPWCHGLSDRYAEKNWVQFVKHEDCPEFSRCNNCSGLLCVDLPIHIPCEFPPGSPIMSTSGHLVGFADYSADRTFIAQNIYHYIDWIDAVINPRTTEDF